MFKQLVMIAAFLLLAVYSLVAQHPEKIYKTLNGNIGFKAVYADTVIVASSSNLIATLDYELATIKFKLNFNTFETGSEFFNSFFHSQIPIMMEFEGKLGIDYIITENHPALDFEVDGIMTLNNIKKRMLLEGTLVHYPTEGDIACNLKLEFDLNLKDFDLTEKFSGFHETLQMEVFQAVLKNYTE